MLGHLRSDNMFGHLRSDNMFGHLRSDNMFVHLTSGIKGRTFMVGHSWSDT